MSEGALAENAENRTVSSASIRNRGEVGPERHPRSKGEVFRRSCSPRYNRLSLFLQTCGGVARAGSFPWHWCVDVDHFTVKTRGTPAAAPLQWRCVYQPPLDDGLADTVVMECNSPGVLGVRRHNRGLVVQCAVLCFVLLVGHSVAGYDAGCDWDGSGLRDPDDGSTSRWTKSRSVVPVYLRCDQGRVTWRYPRGALRVVLRLGGTGSGAPREFRACVKIPGNSTGAAVHLEGHRRLLPIFKGPTPDGDEVHSCFTSYKGQAALFLEATTDTDHQLRRDTLRLWYHLTPVTSRRDLEDDMAECRPCSDRELLHHYCSSDFVVEGTVTSLKHEAKRDVTEITVSATRIHRDSAQEPAFSTENTNAASPVAILQRPLKCGTRAGKGHFLFLGVRVLGKPALQCAPRLQHWRKLRDRALRDGTSPCTLL